MNAVKQLVYCFVWAPGLPAIVPRELWPEKVPDWLNPNGRGSYHSTSILGKVSWVSVPLMGQRATDGSACH